MAFGKVVFVARFVALAIVIVCSLIALAVSAHFMFLTVSRLGGFFYFSPLAIAVGGLSFISLLAIVILDLVTRGKIFSSKIAFEVGWLVFLFVAWMGTAGYSAWTNQQAFSDSDNCNFRSATLRSMCFELPVVVAFSFLAGFISLFYCILLVVYGAINRKSSVFSKSVREASLITSSTATAYHVHYGAKQDYVPQPQQVGYQYGNTPAQGYYNQGGPPMQYPNNAAMQYQPGAVPYQTTPYQQPGMTIPNSPATTIPSTLPPSTFPPSSTPSSMYPQPQAPQEAYPKASSPSNAGSYPEYQAGTPPYDGAQYQQYRPQ